MYMTEGELGTFGCTRVGRTEKGSCTLVCPEQKTKDLRCLVEFDNFDVKIQLSISDFSFCLLLLF